MRSRAYEYMWHFVFVKVTAIQIESCHLLSHFSKAIAAIVIVVIPVTLSNGDDVTWTGAVDFAWENGLNWDNSVGPAASDHVFQNSGRIDFSAASGNSVSLRGIRQTGGRLNISGGVLNGADHPSDYSNLDGFTVHSGGIANINALEIGRTVGSVDTAIYQLSGGDLRAGRQRNGYSLYVGSHSNFSDAGTGILEITGGRLVTRVGVKLGDIDSFGDGTFAVLGSDATEIGIGGSNDDGDGKWEQHSGSTLKVGIDFGGVCPIVLHDNSSSTGTVATFEAGSFLEVDYYDDGTGGGTWTVMEVENGDVVDNGLVFAPSVDTSIWSFRVDNTGANGRLLVTAAGPSAGHQLIVGSELQQKMRFGMDYERLWFWTNSLDSGERDLIAKWSAIDTRIDYIRVAINCAYELEEGQYNLSAYTNKIIPLMQEMKDANPDIKFFASPRPLNEAISGAAWQPYPRWITGDPGNGSFNFDWQNCAEYIERYILLMKSYGFKISFLDITNEWQNPGGSGRITTGDVRDISQYLKANLAPEDMPLIIAPSAWNYSQGANWINDLWTNARREAVDIAACHNTNRTGSAQQFADAVHNVLGEETEIWNTEVHGWKSTSGENETTSFYYYLEKIRAGFSGLNGWLAIGTTNQGHCYILNPSGTPTRNVKYFIFKKLSETSNYGHALNIVEEPTELSHTAALIKGNLMTVWVINQNTNSVPLNITPLGRTLSESTVKRTRWTDPADVEGFETFEYASSNTTFFSSIPGESVCCFEILLDPETFPYATVEAEDEDERNGMVEEPCEDVGGTLNLGRISHGAWVRYNDVEFSQDSTMRFRVARPGGRPDGWVEVYLGSSTDSTATILSGSPVGKVAVPETGDWQVYQTIEACLEASGGTHDVVLRFAEVGGTTDADLFNLNWFAVVSPVSIVADGFQVTAGIQTVGGLPELADSDNADLSVRRDLADISSRVWVELNSTSTTATPSSFALTVEASVFARTAVSQAIELWNYDSGAWEEIDSRKAGLFSDAITTVNASGDLSRFVEPGTNFVEARIRYTSINNPRQIFTANVDQVFWSIE